MERDKHVFVLLWVQTVDRVRGPVRVPGIGPWLSADNIEREVSLGLGRGSHSLEVVFTRVREIVESVVVQPE